MLRNVAVGWFVCMVIIMVLLQVKANWWHWTFQIFPCPIDLRWYSVDTFQATEHHSWTHDAHDLTRISAFAEIPALTNTVIIPPKHTYIALPETITAPCTSFVKACSVLCRSALKHRKQIRIGIVVSVRLDDRRGNFVRIPLCLIREDMTTDEICQTIATKIRHIRASSTPVVTLKEFIAMGATDLVFNNWRNIETMHQRAPHLRLLCNGVPLDSVNFSRAHQLYLSNDTKGWYIVKTGPLSNLSLLKIMV